MLKDCVSGWVHTDETVCGEYLAPPGSAPPGGYWCTTHQMYVTHPDSPLADAPDDPVASTLAEIRERYEWGADRYVTLGEVRNSAADVPRLLAAVEAALKVHQPVDRGTGAQCKGCATHVTFTRWPCPTVRAIAAALAGEDGGDGDQGS